jgi:hypothetical protein
MIDEKILDELITLLEAHSVKTRIEHLDDGSGGFCKIQGETVVFLNKDNSSIKQATVCAEALVQVVDINTFYIRPEIRQFIENIENEKNRRLQLDSEG